jgi:serine protease Do
MTRPLTLVFAGAVFGACATWVPDTLAGSKEGNAGPPVAEVPAANTPTPVMDTYHPMQSFAPLVEAVEAAVVAIQVEAVSANNDLRDVPAPFRHLFLNQPSVQRGEGSGFIISEDGLVLTNAHVVSGADRIQVLLRDGKSAPATVLGLDQSMDIALLQLTGNQKWPHVDLGSSGSLKVGDWVLAMGNPLGLGHTVTAGIVSAKGRVLGQDLFGNEDYIQTDAAINQGNSGGPLFDIHGNVVGMNTAIIAGANTIGFAIPADLLTSVIGELATHGHISRGYLGVEPLDLTPQLAQELGVDATEGALIRQVYQNTPAAKSGLVSKDVVITVDDVAIRDRADLIKAVANKRPGEHVNLMIVRGTQQHRVKLKLAERPGGR